MKDLYEDHNWPYEQLNWRTLFRSSVKISE